jgi:4-hydroxybenzoate polyprenyltransferase
MRFRDVFWIGPTEECPPSTLLLKKLFTTLEMVKIEHTLFALPFAFLGAMMAARQMPGGVPGAGQIGWILVAMVGARSAGMAFNRLVDLPFDARNPRTSRRALPQKQLTRGYVAVFILIASAVFTAAAAMLNPLALRLSPLALAIVLLYSYMKRFTWGTHFFLGLALGCAPVGAWVAILGTLSAVPLLLGLAVLLWVAGFDIIYACQDVDFDRTERLHSIPGRFGIRRALWISGGLHACMVVLLALVFGKAGLGTISFVGLGLVTILLAYEHSLVKPADLSRVNAAFFTVNGWISVLLFIMTGIDIFRHRV